MDRGTGVVELPMWLVPDRLTDFLAGLRLSGYRLGVEEFIVIQDLVLALIEKGESFEDPARLANVLGPVVCKSQTEQADFHKRFEDWRSTSPGNRQARLLHAASSTRNSFDDELRNLGTQRRLWLRSGIAVAILAVVLAIWLFIRRA